MKLVDLKPGWVGTGGEGISDKDGNPVPSRKGVGVAFDCPCGKCGQRVFLSFENPMDGGKPFGSSERPHWKRTGDTFETLTLTPSILQVKTEEGDCGWHGFLTDGEFKSV